MKGKTKQEQITEIIIENNFYMVEAVRKGDIRGVKKYKMLLDNLIKIYLKEFGGGISYE